MDNGYYMNMWNFRSFVALQISSALTIETMQRQCVMERIFSKFSPQLH